jgi:hypothetical protein
MGRDRLNAMRKSLLVAIAALPIACGSFHASPPTPAESEATLAQIYFWRAKPGKLDEYTRYVRDVAEPIDHEAQRTGAFLSVRTYLANDSTLPWTHMRVFLLRDSAQLRGLSAALDAAGVRLEPDSLRRRQRGDYSATLRDRVGATVTQLVKR